MTFIVPCPNCGTTYRTQYVTHRNDPEVLSSWHVDVMCWEECGMDFRVNYIWYILNRIGVEEE